MKKFITALCIVALTASVADARPHGSHHGASHHGNHISSLHRHHHGNAIAGFVTGLIGGSILNYALTQSQPRTITTTTYSPTVYTPTIVSTPTIISAPTVVTTPSIATTSTVVTTSQPCYTNTNLVTGATTSNCGATISSPIVSQIYYTR